MGHGHAVTCDECTKGLRGDGDGGQRRLVSGSVDSACCDSSVDRTVCGCRMTHQEFESVLANTTRRVKQVLATKNAEYASEKDKQHNFRLAAGLQDCSPARALFGMMAKHVVSINDLITRHDAGTATELWVWCEKITDAIAYLILLEAIVREFSGEPCGEPGV